MTKSPTGGQIIARLTGGLGNQLFIYAAARRIALERGAQLLVDGRSAFARDKYRAIYQLGHFVANPPLASPAECFVTPSERRRREVLKGLSKALPLRHKFIVTEADFPIAEFRMPLRRKLRIEGYWQAERYFQPIADTIRRDFSIVTPLSAESEKILEAIRGCQAVCLHIRQLRGAPHAPGMVAPPGFAQLPFAYYERAIAYIAARIANPVFFCFGDDPDWLPKRWHFPFEARFVGHNRAQENAYEDLALMTNCRHFIIANSTFSWWAAWLAGAADKLVVAPSSTGKLTWASDPDIIPDRWHVIAMDDASGETAESGGDNSPRMDGAELA